MNKCIKISLIFMVLSAHITTALAGRDNYKPAHGGYPDASPRRSTTNLSDLPDGVHRSIARFLNPSSFNSFARSCKATAELGRDPVLGFEVSKNGTPVYDLEGNIRYTDKVSHAFADLGRMHRVAGLIWSGVAPRTMNQRDAVAYCAGLGGGARLPTKEEFIALSRAMGSRQPDRNAPGHDLSGYNRNLIPDTNNRWFWSSSAVVHPWRDDLAFVFVGDYGEPGDGRRDANMSVRCVR